VLDKTFLKKCDGCVTYMRNYFVVAAAIQCLKKKKLYETQIEQLSNFQLRVHDQVTKDVDVSSIMVTHIWILKGCNKLMGIFCV
jgi:hypothetical protein